MKLLRWAAVLAIESGMEQIDHSLLGQAYEERLAQDFPRVPNPFISEIASRRLAPARRTTPALDGTNKRIKPRKNKPTISDVLSHR